jgi:hypothetical protein
MQEQGQNFIPFQGNSKPVGKTVRPGKIPGWDTKKISSPGK